MMLCVLYSRGLGFPVNDGLAGRYFVKSIILGGCGLAYEWYAFYLRNGLGGIKKDANEAVTYYQKALECGRDVSERLEEAKAEAERLYKCQHYYYSVDDECDCRVSRHWKEDDDGKVIEESWMCTGDCRVKYQNGYGQAIYVTYSACEFSYWSQERSEKKWKKAILEQVEEYIIR